ncbi:MAG: hypothetical protein HKN16_10265, partial [Saprospiraceae bacterium]|nr:hypothetical protein [Saprospiraceae bacterium]
MRYLPFLFLLLLFACSDDDSSGKNLTRPIGDCQFLFDSNGASIGTLGDCNDSQWATEGINDFERDLFLHPDTLQTNEDFIELQNIIAGVFPNPAMEGGQIFFFIGGDQVAGKKSKLRLVVISESNEVLIPVDFALEAGFNNLAFNLQNGFPKGQSYRIYYQLFANSAEPY